MARELSVVNTTQRIVINPTNRAVSVILAGPQGPPGEVTQATLDAAVAALQAQIDDLQSQIDTHHP